jgi:hypothetical protein
MAGQLKKKDASVLTDGLARAAAKALKIHFYRQNQPLAQ